MYSIIHAMYEGKIQYFCIAINTFITLVTVNIKELTILHYTVHNIIISPLQTYETILK